MIFSNELEQRFSTNLILNVEKTTAKLMAVVDVFYNDSTTIEASV